MVSYEQTLEDFREAISLGYSPREVINDLENDTETNSKALKELQNLLETGI